MKNLFYLFALAILFVFSGCSSNSNSRADKFLGTWKETGKNPVTFKITEGEGNTYDLFSPKREGVINSKDTTFKGFKYDPDRDVLYRNKGVQMEIVYNKDSETIQAFVNHRPATDPQKKVKE